MKKKTRLSAIGIAAVLGITLIAVACSTPEKRTWNEGINIIPVPVQLTQQEGTFTLDKNTVIVCGSPDFAKTAAYLASKIKGSTGYELSVVNQPPNENYILLMKEDSVAHKEGYGLVSSPKGVEIVASTDDGAFFGMQTLLQLLPAEIESP